jgi:hypothetical protein
VQRSNTEHDAQSGSPAAAPTAKKKGEEGQLFSAKPPKKEGKIRSSAFPARTKQTKPNKIHYFLFLI